MSMIRANSIAGNSSPQRISGDDVGYEYRPVVSSTASSEHGLPSGSNKPSVTGKGAASGASTQRSKRVHYGRNFSKNSNKGFWANIYVLVPFVFVVSVIFGTIFYSFHHGWDVSMAFFYSTQVLLGNNIGTPEENDSLGQAFTLCFFMFGVSILAGAVGAYASVLVTRAAHIKSQARRDARLLNTPVGGTPGNSTKSGGAGTSSRSNANGDLSALSWADIVTHWFFKHLNAWIPRSRRKAISRAIGWESHKSKYLTVIAAFLWCMVGVCYGLYFEKWPLSTSLYFAVGTMSASGMPAPLLTECTEEGIRVSDGSVGMRKLCQMGFMRSMLWTIYIVVGVPLFALTLGQISGFVVEKAVREQEMEIMARPLGEKEFAFACSLHNTRRVTSSSPRTTGGTTEDTRVVGSRSNARVGSLDNRVDTGTRGSVGSNYQYRGKGGGMGIDRAKSWGDFRPLAQETSVDASTDDDENFPFLPEVLYRPGTLYPFSSSSERLQPTAPKQQQSPQQQPHVVSVSEKYADSEKKYAGRGVVVAQRQQEQQQQQEEGSNSCSGNIPPPHIISADPFNVRPMSPTGLVDTCSSKSARSRSIYQGQRYYADDDLVSHSGDHIITDDSGRNNNNSNNNIYYQGLSTVGDETKAEMVHVGDQDQNQDRSTGNTDGNRNDTHDGIEAEPVIEADIEREIEDFCFDFGDFVVLELLRLKRVYFSDLQAIKDLFDDIDDDGSGFINKDKLLRYHVALQEEQEEEQEEGLSRYHAALQEEQQECTHTLGPPEDDIYFSSTPQTQTQTEAERGDELTDAHTPSGDSVSVSGSESESREEQVEERGEEGGEEEDRDAGSGADAEEIEGDGKQLATAASAGTSSSNIIIIDEGDEGENEGEGTNARTYREKDAHRHSRNAGYHTAATEDTMFAGSKDTGGVSYGNGSDEDDDMGGGGEDGDRLGEPLRLSSSSPEWPQSYLHDASNSNSSSRGLFHENNRDYNIEREQQPYSITKSSADATHDDSGTSYSGETSHRPWPRRQFYERSQSQSQSASNNSLSIISQRPQQPQHSPSPPPYRLRHSTSVDSNHGRPTQTISADSHHDPHHRPTTDATAATHTSTRPTTDAVVAPRTTSSARLHQSYNALMMPVLMHRMKKSVAATTQDQESSTIVTAAAAGTASASDSASTDTERGGGGNVEEEEEEEGDIETGQHPASIRHRPFPSAAANTSAASAIISSSRGRPRSSSLSYGDRRSSTGGVGMNMGDSMGSDVRRSLLGSSPTSSDMSYGRGYGSVSLSYPQTASLPAAPFPAYESRSRLRSRSASVSVSAAGARPGFVPGTDLLPGSGPLPGGSSSSRNNNSSSSNRVRFLSSDNSTTTAAKTRLPEQQT